MAYALKSITHPTSNSKPTVIGNLSHLSLSLPAGRANVLPLAPHSNAKLWGAGVASAEVHVADRAKYLRLVRRASIDLRTANTSESLGKLEGMGANVPAVIVSAGRVGQTLEKMGWRQDVVVRQRQLIPAVSQCPILVCTRDKVLGAIIDVTPPSWREDLVFIQNGMLEPFLESKGVPEATMVLAYFAVAKAGNAPLDGKTDLNPDGIAAASGKWAPAIAACLQSAGLSCKVLGAAEFTKPLLEKLMWIAAFMLVGACHPGAMVGVVEKEHQEEVVTLIRKRGVAAETEKKVKFDAGIKERLRAYAHSVTHFPTAVKEFEWRNGWFSNISQRALARGALWMCFLPLADQIFGNSRVSHQEAEDPSSLSLGKHVAKLSSSVVALAATTLVTATAFNVDAVGAVESLGLGAAEVFQNTCSGCHSGGGNILQPAATLFKKDLEKNGLLSVDDIYNITYSGKNRMPGYGEKCTPRGQCTFGPRLSEENIRALADFVKIQADRGWAKVPT